MRKLIALLLLLALPAFGQLTLGNAVIGNMTVHTNVGAVTYLIDEDCEGGSTPVGWTDSGTPTWGYVPALIGLASIQFNTTLNSKYTTSPTFTTDSEVWAFCALQITGYPSSSVGIVNFRDSTGNICSFQMATNGRLGVGGAWTTDSVALDTLTYAWFHYKAGTGADGEWEVGFSTDETKPTSGTKYQNSTTFTGTAPVDRIRFGITANMTIALTMDKFRADDVEIGSSPE